MINIFDEIIECLKYKQREEELFANVNRDEDFWRAMHESKIGALGDAINMIKQVTEELWTPATQEPSENGEYIVYCRRCHDNKEVVSSVKYCFGEWKISNAFDLIGWIPYSKLFNVDAALER